MWDHRRHSAADGGPTTDRQRFGGEGPALDEFLSRVRSLSVDEARAYRAAVLRRVSQSSGDGSVQGGAVEHAAVISRLIRAAVRGGRREIHASAMAEADVALNVSGRTEEGIGAWVRDVAGAIAVRDVIDEQDFEYLYGPWEEAVGR